MSLIDQLITVDVLKTPEIIAAFEKIKREYFIPEDLKSEAEGNYPLPIGYDQTISQPLTVAFMLELLAARPGDKVLDVGSGSGWTTALLAEIVGIKGKVFALEIIPELKKFGEDNAEKYGFCSSGRVKFITGDGAKGYESEAPFDRILVSAAASKIPAELIKQLPIGGRLVIPVGDSEGAEIQLLVKDKNGKIKTEHFPGFVFVPLV